MDREREEYLCHRHSKQHYYYYYASDIKTDTPYALEGSHHS